MNTTVCLFLYGAWVSHNAYDTRMVNMTVGIIFEATCQPKLVISSLLKIDCGFRNFRNFRSSLDSLEVGTMQLCHVTDARTTRLQIITTPAILQNRLGLGRKRY